MFCETPFNDLLEQNEFTTAVTASFSAPVPQDVNVKVPPPLDPPDEALLVKLEQPLSTAAPPPSAAANKPRKARRDRVSSEDIKPLLCSDEPYGLASLRKPFETSLGLGPLSIIRCLGISSARGDHVWVSQRDVGLGGRLGPGPVQD